MRRMSQTSRISPRCQQPSRRDRHQRESQEQRGEHGEDDGARQRPVHSSLDARHREQRQENRCDDERRERNRPADLERSAERALAPAAMRAVQDVLDHDDRGVDEQADGDGEPAERHRVEPDARRREEEHGEKHGDGQGNGDEDGGA